MSDRQDAVLHVLVEHAEGRRNHLNLGLCPDRLEGHDSRDPECPICVALTEAGDAS